MVYFVVLILYIENETTVMFKKLHGSEFNRLTRRIPTLKENFHGFVLITTLVLIICFLSFNFLVGLDIFGYILLLVLSFIPALYYFRTEDNESFINDIHVFMYVVLILWLFP
jgi:hypothetical protein